MGKYIQVANITKPPSKKKLTNVEITAYRGYLCIIADQNANGVIGTPHSGNLGWTIELDQVKVSPDAKRLLENVHIGHAAEEMINVWSERGTSYISWISDSKNTIIKASLLNGARSYDSSLLRECDGLITPLRFRKKIDAKVW